jgi:mannose-6-phosphate isomerase-like protein (cupin superfamily)
MASWDHGGGCPCGLNRVCDCGKYDENNIERLGEGTRNCSSCLSDGYEMRESFCTAGTHCVKTVSTSKKTSELTAVGSTKVKPTPVVQAKIAIPRETETTVTKCKRPWGEWYVLDVGQGYKVKRLEILPDASISLQYHEHRSESWVITQGTGRAVINGDIFTVTAGDTFVVPALSIHKITNIGNTVLKAIEVQIGSICDEEDIKRV